MIKELWFDSQQDRAKHFLFFQAPSPALGPTQRRITNFEIEKKIACACISQIIF